MSLTGLGTVFLSAAREKDEIMKIKRIAVRIAEKTLLLCFILPSIIH